MPGASTEPPSARPTTGPATRWRSIAEHQGAGAYIAEAVAGRAAGILTKRCNTELLRRTWRMLRAFLILLAISQIGAAPLPVYGARWDGAGEPVSLVALLANPTHYDGRTVRVDGFLNLEFEGNALYLDGAAFEAALARNAIWIDLPPAFDKRLARRLNRRYSTVEGVFVASEHGHMGAYSGTLTDVRRIVPLMTRADFEAYMNDTYAASMVRDPRVWLLLFGALAAPGIIWFSMTRRRRP